MAEATKAHTEVPSDGHKTAFPPFQKETFPSQLFWLAVTLALLYLIASKLALPRIGGIFEQRREKIEGDLGEAQRLREQSDAALAEYEKTLAEARARAQAMASETHSRLVAEGEQRRKELEAALNARLAEAEKSIAATRDAAMANVRAIAAEAASAIVERLIGSAPADAAVRAAVDDALKR
jgi:F-type H+-transporting ATPase subunit b